MEKEVKSPKSVKLWSLINLVGFLLVIVINTFANTLPLNGVTTGELSDSYPNLFVPAGITFAIWGVIYLLLLGYIVQQLVLAFNDNREDSIISTIGPFFLLSSLANSLWIIAWHWKKVGISFVIMLALLSFLIIIYLRINNGAQHSMMRLTFSVYLGWITVATIANATAFLVNINWGGFGLSEVFWTVVVLIAATLITLLMLFIRKDIPYALVVIWAFLGILIKRTSSSIPADNVVEAAVGICMIILGLMLLFTIYRKVRAGKSS